MEKPIRIIPDERHRRMYRLQWRNGDLSRDAYNLTRASGILRNYDAYLADMANRGRMRGNKRALAVSLTPPMRQSEEALP